MKKSDRKNNKNLNLKKKSKFTYLIQFYESGSVESPDPYLIFKKLTYVFIPDSRDDKPGPVEPKLWKAGTVIGNIGGE